ncbi:MAG: hypothetical protein ACLSUW_00630 [Akkermansia sp.]
MGSGDAWILMMAGCACGWQGALFSLFLGSLLGIVQAAASHGVRQKPPLWPRSSQRRSDLLLGGSQWWQAYIRFISGE